MAIANSYGWEILSPAAFSVYWNGGPNNSDIVITPLDDYAHLMHFAMSNFSRGIVTFHTGYLFRTPPGWNLMATGPFNQPKDGVSPLTGVIETDWLPYPFTMNWQLTRPGIVYFEKDEPICLVYPIQQNVLEQVQPEIVSMDSNAELVREYVAWKVEREMFMEKYRSGDVVTLKAAWQKYYFKGEQPTGNDPITNHQAKLRLREPIDLRNSTTSVG